MDAKVEYWLQLKTGSKLPGMSNLWAAEPTWVEWKWINLDLLQIVNITLWT